MNPKRGVKFDQPFATGKGPVMLPPLHPNCLPAGSLVSAGSGITAATERWYEGDMVVVRTASGHELSATPNHPVLTDQGWIGAGALHKGHSLVRRIGQEALSAHGRDHENVPTRIEDVARALLKAGKVTARKVPVAPEDFHGDGRGSEVAVVTSYGLLRDALKPARLQHRVKDLLQSALQPLIALLGPGDLSPVVFSLNRTAHCLMGTSDLALTSGGIHVAPLQCFGIGRAAKRDTGTHQRPTDSAAADAVLARQIIDGSTGPVAFDQIIDVRRYPFVGHVFNLETVHGHYTANNLISHNCRCSVYIRQWEPEQLS
jgi:hypothetical protein